MNEEARNDQAGSEAQSGARELRKRYNALIDVMNALGRSDEAEQVAELAVRQGLWKRPDQRPIHFIPDLPARPVHDPRLFFLASYLERNATMIAQEARAVLLKEQQALSPVEEPLVATGNWDMAAFYEGGERSEPTCRRFPRIAEVIDQAPAEVRQAGLVMLSFLQPGTHIVPHCGFSNARLRIHLCLESDPKASLRVGNERLTWETGRCIVFDDSFEHEVVHEGERPRLVLLVDCFHPALSQQDREKCVREFEFDRKAKAGAMMRLHRLRGIETVPDDDRFLARFEPDLERQVRRHMAESGSKGLKLTEDGRLDFDPVEADADS